MSGLDQDAGFIAEALPAFVSEAQEQAATAEQLLLQLEDAPQERDLLDALFRCVHTVKGSAGVFGLENVVGFTHHVETLLHRMREGEIAFTSELGTLLLQCNDQIRSLVEAARFSFGDALPADEVRDSLVARLRRAVGDMAGADAGPARTAATSEAASAGVVSRRSWHLSVQFAPQTFRDGFDPLAVLHYLDNLGTVQQVVCDAGAVPQLDTIDPEECHLGFRFGLETDARREQIEAAFSLVREDCAIELIEPPSGVHNLVALIEGMPENQPLGQILVAAGAVSPAQLGQSLKEQQARAGAAPPGPRIGEILQESAGVDAELVNAALQKQRKQRESAAAAGAEEGRFIRVKADRLDAVINLLGELVIASAGASMLARQAGQRGLIEANRQVAELVEDIRNGTLQLRMVPIGETFSRFRRVVRDTAAELGKEVALEIEGADTELDKSVVERIADPLMHLVRNALDHGLETPQQRVDAGKPTQGHLTISACHEAGSILIRIADDGRGIGRRRVLETAWERGLLERGATPPDADILKLIFEPGFSTAEKVTNLSGRGVGMDVVRRNIEALRGSVRVFSEEGEGTRIEIRLPLTLAIIDGFLVSVGPSKFIFPLDVVVEVIESRAAASAMDARGRSIVELRGQVLPVVSLRALYGLESAGAERTSVVVIRTGTGRYGVLVDQLLGQHQTVIKPLSRMFRKLRGISGSSILGNGEVALICDAASLGELAVSET